MINKTGFSLLNQNFSSPNEGQTSFPSLDSSVVSGRVTDIVLDENHPKIDEVGGLNGIGTIFFELNGILSSEDSKTAKPLHPQNKTFPVINEIVLLFALPNSEIGQDESLKSYFYISNVNVWNHPHHNALPNPVNDDLPPYQQKDYQQVEGGSVRRVTDESTEIKFNSKYNPSQNTFIERTNIHPLMPFMGDIIYEGRFGQSLRLGTTAKSDSFYKNSWSIVGNNGDPITILRNGQPQNTSDRGWVPITEDINEDLSSIYLTSYQKLGNFNIASDNYGSYPTPPEKTNSYTNPQVILNSDRIIINAKTDNVLLSSQKSIGMSSIESVNIDTKKHYINANDVRLGSKDATQPVLKGNDTVELLKQLTQELISLTQALQTSQIFPGGTPVPDPVLAPIATNSNLVLNNILNRLNDNKNGIKSNFVKVK